MRISKMMFIDVGGGGKEPDAEYTIGLYETNRYFEALNWDEITINKEGAAVLMRSLFYGGSDLDSVQIPSSISRRFAEKNLTTFGYGVINDMRKLLKFGLINKFKAYDVQQIYSAYTGELPPSLEAMLKDLGAAIKSLTWHNSAHDARLTSLGLKAMCNKLSLYPDELIAPERLIHLSGVPAYNQNNVFREKRERRIRCIPPQIPLKTFAQDRELALG